MMVRYIMAMLLATAPVAAAQEPCTAEADGRYSAECLGQLLDQQHQKSYELGYGDGCAAASKAGVGTFEKFFGAETEGAVPGFACRRTVAWPLRLGSEADPTLTGGTASIRNPIDFTGTIPSDAGTGGNWVGLERPDIEAERALDEMIRSNRIELVPEGDSFRMQLR